MPLYEYQCPDCGPFSAWRSMSVSAGPTGCPGCQVPAERILSATQIARPGGSGRRRGSVEPRLIQKSADPAPPPKKPDHQHAHGRPWMFGH
jgi:putative FmdB family regulatory protein